MVAPLLQLETVSRHFGSVKAVDGVSFDIQPGECFGLVGESGSGKSTIASMIAGLDAPTGGRIMLGGRSVGELARGQGLARQLQMVFQDPLASLNPRKTVRQIVGLPLSVQRVGRRADRLTRVADALDRVGLGPADQILDRYPASFSGGQRQRIAIARALVGHPQIIVADEPVSALDVSIRSQIINLLTDLKRSLSLTIFLISHDLSTIRTISDRIGVLYRGRLVELTDRYRIVAPQHPYTELLLSVLLLPHDVKPLHRLPQIDRRGALVPQGGCPFYPRCPRGTPLCVDHAPVLRDVAGVQVACHHPSAERVSAALQ